jgi:ribosome-associated protein
VSILATKKSGGNKSQAKTAAKCAATKRSPRPAGPKIHASHASAGAGSRPGRARSVSPALKGPRPAGAPKKTPLAGPKRAAQPRRTTPPSSPEASSKSRELAVTLAAEGIEKKALGIEILDVSGKVDYADFLVIMTGRSDRHVHAIATGLEEAMRKKKSMALSVEGLQAATWVLLDFGDVVVHVFQEDARALYDIEGLWIDAGRVPVPNTDGAGPNAPTSHLD